MNRIIMLTSQIGTVWKQALTTFTNKEMFYQNLEILKALMDKISAEDINLHPQFMTEALWKTPHKAPVTYMDIYEDGNVTIGTFILKPNMRIPLHNHPQMHGLIKVIEGQLKITSFSINTERTREIDKTPSITKFLAERCSDVIVDKHSDCCMLEPELRNLHEIESVDGPAAFIDILAPPYETISLGHSRKCSYYQAVREIEPDLFQLQEISAPSWFWTDTFPYTGPGLTQT